MAAEFDVAGRLAEARQAIDNTQNYVWACHLLDFQNPDLTLHPGQVSDWFGSEDGMDLHALDSDRAALEAAAAAGEEALAVQRSQVVRLAGAWAGSGADVADDFLRAHCEAGASAAAAVGKAAEALAGLRDNLWQMVDGKVAAVVSIDDRSQAERAAWLSAASTVTTGVGDRAKASELVDQQVKPFIDNDIRVDWLNAVRATIAAIARSYEAATAGLIAQPDAAFDVPGDLGPRWAPTRDAADMPNDDPVESNGRTFAAAAPAPAGSPSPPPPAVPAAGWPSPPSPAVPAAVAPSFAPVAPAPPASSPMPADASTPTAMPAAAPPAPAVPTMPQMPSAPLGDLSSLGQRLAEAIGGMLPTADDAVGDTSGLDEPSTGDEPGQPDEPTTADEQPKDEEKQTDDAASDNASEEKAEEDGEERGGCAADATPPPPDPAAEPVAEPPPPPEPPPAEQPPAPAPPPADPAPPPPPEAPPPAPASTPCEIAADELPQAGQ